MWSKQHYQDLSKTVAIKSKYACADRMNCQHSALADESITHHLLS